MKHLLTGAAGGPSFSKQVACSECHNAAIPATPLHANGLPNVAFGTLAKTGAVTPSYTGRHLLQHLLPRQLHERRRRQPDHLDRRGDDLHLLPRHASRRDPPGRLHARHLRQLPRQLQQRHASPSSTRPGTSNGSVDLSNMSCTSCHGTQAAPASPART